MHEQLPGDKSPWWASKRVSRGLACAAYGVPLLAMAVALLASLWLDVTALQALMNEGGPVENATVVVYGSAVLALALGLRLRGDWGSRLATMALVAAMGAREMDLHKAGGEKSILKVSYYLGDIPWQHKLAALLAVLPVLVSLGYLVARHWRAGWQLARRRGPLTVTALVFVATLVLSKLLDRSASVLPEDLGIVLPVFWVSLLLSMEELLELALPAVILVGVAQQRVQAWAAAPAGSAGRYFWRIT